jgi:signal transduction histidine kinase
VNTGDVGRASQILATVLLRDVEQIAEHSAARMQARVASYAKLPREELVPVVLANTRNLLEAIRDPGGDRAREREDYRVAGLTRARQGIPTDDMLHAWRIGLEVVREEAYALADQLEVPTDAMLEFVETTLRWGDAGMGASASAHREAELEIARDEFGRLAEEQAALRRVATLAAQGAPSERLAAVVAEQVGRVLRVPVVRITRFEADGSATHWAGFSEQDDDETFPVGGPWPLDGSGVVSRVRSSGQPARVDEHGELDGEARGASIRSTVATPISVGGRLWGAMLVESMGPDVLPAETEARLADFTELLAMAISNAQARAEVEWLAEEQAALRRVATMVAREASPEEVFAQVAEEVGRLLGADAAKVQRYESGEEAVVVGAWGMENHLSSRWRLDCESATAAVYRTRRPVRFDDYEHALGALAADARELGLRSAVASPIVVDGRLWGALGAATSRTGSMPADTESRIAQFTELVATAISNVQARSDVERLAEVQAALRRVAMMVARESPPDEIFATVAEDVGLILNAEAAIVQRYEPDGFITTVGTWGTLRGVFPVGCRRKLDENSITARVFRTGGSVRVDGEDTDENSIAAPAREAGLRSAVGSPIVVDGRLWGALGAGTSRAQPLPVGAESRIAQFSELLATAISNVEARSDLAGSRARLVAAADEERRRVVRDLHDGAQQRLVHTVVTLRLARIALERDTEEAVALVDEALQHAQTGTEELRELAHGILPAVLTDGGLGAGVRALASRMSIPVEVDVSVDRLPEAVEASAYFIVAEALTNVAKHSRALHAAVTARVEDGTLQVEVRDDGVGGVAVNGTGLIGLRDRVAVFDGSLGIDSPPGGGTSIQASIPVRQHGMPAGERREDQV